MKIKLLDDYGNDLLNEQGELQYEEVDRSKVTQELIEDDVNTIVEGGETVYLIDILREGFIGYAKYTEEELEQEWLTRFRHQF